MLECEGGPPAEECQPSFPEGFILSCEEKSTNKGGEHLGKAQKFSRHFLNLLLLKSQYLD